MEQIVKHAFKEYFYLKDLKSTDTLESLGGDSLDVIEVAIFIEEEYSEKLLCDYIISNSFLENKFATMPIADLIKELPNHLNPA